jgi:hypothetical protein
VCVENYGSVLRDCPTVITANPRASKAYYRMGLALLTLERVDEALDTCTHAGEGRQMIWGSRRCARVQRRRMRS